MAMVFMPTLHAAALNGNLSLIKSILQNGALVDQIDHNGRTALHLCCLKGNLDIAKCLIKNNADVDKQDNDGRTALHRASLNGHLVVVELLLEKRAIVNDTSHNGRAALHLCCQKGHFDIAKILIENNADVDKQDNKKWTPLQSASNNGHITLVELLLEKRAAVNHAHDDGCTALLLCCARGHKEVAQILIEKNADVNQQNNDGWAPLHLASQNGHLVVVELLLDKGALVNDTSHNGRTALLLCCQQGHFDIAKILIENNADVDKQDNKKWTPLQLASQNGHITLVELLLEKRAAVNHAHDDGCTALLLCCARGHKEVAQILIEKNADVNQQNNGGWAPLHLASQNGHLVVVELLLDKGALVNDTSHDGRTALHLCCQQGNLDVTKMLIENNADVNKQDGDGWTSLHFASDMGHLSIVELLLKKEALINHTSHNGRIALHQSCHRGHVDVAKILIENNAEINKVSINGGAPLHHYVRKHHSVEFIRYLLKMGAESDIYSHSQCTPLHVAATKGNHMAVSSLISFGSQVNLVDKNGETAFIKSVQSDSLDTLKILKNVSDVNYKDYDGNNALHHAVISGKTMTVQSLMNIGIDVNSVNNLQQTPMHFASEYGYDEVANILLKNGASVNSLDIDRSTPLHLAAKEGHPDMVHLLIQHGINIEAIDISNRTPLSVASLRGQSSVVQILLQMVNEANQGDLIGQTALHLAASYGHFDVVHQFMDKFPEVATLLDNSGLTPADIALRKGYGKIANYMESEKYSKTYSPLNAAKRKCDDLYNEKPGMSKKIRFDVLQSLDKYITSLCKDCLGPTWTWKRVGSSYEGTRIGDPNECDYLLADLRIACLFQGEWELTNDTAFCTCKVSQDIPEMYRTAVKAHGNRNVLSSLEYHRLFRDVVCQYICELEDADGLIKCKENVHDEYKRQAAASSCALLWMGNDQYAGMIIDTDFVPAIIIYDWPDDAVKPENLMPGLDYKEPLFENGIPYIYLVAKPPHAESDLGQRLNSSQRDCLWRIDFAHVCSRIVASLPPRLKDVYIMAKAVREEMGPLLHPVTGKSILKPKTADQPAQEEYEVKDFVTSYQLKITFLHEVRNNFLHNSSLTLDEMVLMVYDKLVRYLERGSLPDFVLNNSDILAGTKLKHEECLPAANFARDFVKKQVENGGLDKNHLTSVL